MMRFIAFCATALSSLLVVVSSFQPCRELSTPCFVSSSVTAQHIACRTGLHDRRTNSLPALALSSSSDEEQRALALSEYLAKAHEEKLRAIQDVEKKKAAEIQALQNEIQELKAQQSSAGRPSAGGAITMASSSSSAYAGAEDLMSLPKDVLANKVIQYQRFMEKYIVEAQEQKFRAVKAAEDSMRKKYESQLALGPASAPAPASSLASPPAVASGGETALYQARSAAVAKAAAAGKSRWGDMEVQRASSVNVGAAIVKPSVVASAPAASSILAVPPEVEAADHGIKADGSLSLAERVAKGVNAGAEAVAQAASATRSTTASSMASALSAATSLYEKRNARVLASAAAGASRWGSMEIERVRSLASLPSSRASTAPAVSAATAAVTVVPPEVVAADHGLRSDGSVGGPTLAERIAQGAGASSGSGSAVPAASSASRPAILSLYDRRNIRVLESAAAGKSRWGSREVDRVRDIANHLLSAGGSSAPQPIAGRVNLGAQLLQKK